MNKLPKVILPVLLTLVLLLVGCSAGSNPSVVQIGEPAPDFQLKNLDGQSISLSALRGKPVLINFWATWCPPCRYEMPYLQQTYEEWSDRVWLLAIDIGESPSTVEEFMQSNNLSLPVLLDTKKVASQKYNVTGIPTTLFIDEAGIIQGIKIGSFQSKEEIEAGIGGVISH